MDSAGGVGVAAAVLAESAGAWAQAALDNNVTTRQIEIVLSILKCFGDE